MAVPDSYPHYLDASSRFFDMPSRKYRQARLQLGASPEVPPGEAGCKSGLLSGPPPCADRRRAENNLTQKFDITAITQCYLA